MPALDGKDRKIETSKTRLLKAAQTYGTAYAAMSAARAELHDAIREASALGLSRRDVAARAGVTPGLVQQLVDGTTGARAAAARAAAANARAAERAARASTRATDRAVKVNARAVERARKASTAADHAAHRKSKTKP